MKSNTYKPFGQPEDVVNYNHVACTRGQALKDLVRRGCSQLSAEKLAYMLPVISADQAKRLPTLKAQNAWDKAHGCEHLAHA